MLIENCIVKPETFSLLKGAFLLSVQKKGQTFYRLTFYKIKNSLFNKGMPLSENAVVNRVRKT